MIHVLDRLFMFFYSIIVVISTLFMLFLSFHWIHDSLVRNVVYYIQNIVWLQSTAMVISIFILLYSIRLLYLSIRSSKGSGSAIDQKTDFGDISISIETVENLALKAASRVKGAKDLRARVQVTEAGLELKLRTIIDGDSPIPQLTEEMQSMVKEQIEEITGIPVAFVSVFVANVTQAHSLKSRVE